MEETQEAESSTMARAGENRAGETLRWIAQQREQQQTGEVLPRSNSAPPRLENMSQDYLAAFLRTIQTNLGDHGRALAQIIAEQQRASTHNSLESTTVPNSSESTTVAPSESTTVAPSEASSVDERLDDLVLTFDNVRCTIA